MEVEMPERKETLKVDVNGVNVKIVSEPFVVNTTRGYAAAVNVAVEDGGEEKTMFISAKSLSDALERMAESNGGRFTGLKLSLKKESEQRYAGYVVERL
jgi:hypothetical protein